MEDRVLQEDRPYCGAKVIGPCRHPTDGMTRADGTPVPELTLYQRGDRWQLVVTLTGETLSYGDKQNTRDAQGLIDGAEKAYYRRPVAPVSEPVAF